MRLLVEYLIKRSIVITPNEKEIFCERESIRFDTIKIKSLTINPASHTLSGAYIFSEIVADQIIISEGVKFIETKTFFNCKSVKKIVIPETVQKIDSDAFLYSSFEQIELSEKNKNFYKKDGVIYNILNQFIAEEKNKNLFTAEQFEFLKSSKSRIITNEIVKFWNDIFINQKNQLELKNNFFITKKEPFEKLIELLNNGRAEKDFQPKSQRYTFLTDTRLKEKFYSKVKKNRTDLNLEKDAPNEWQDFFDDKNYSSKVLSYATNIFLDGFQFAKNSTLR